MNKGWIVLGVVVAIVAVGAFYVMTGDGVGTGLRSMEEITEGEATSAQDDESAAVTGSMQDLMARGGSWKCDFTHSTDAGDSTGTVYTSGGMVRGNFTTQVPQMGAVESHMIARDGFVYTWSNMMPQGVKIPMASAESPAQAQGQTNYYAQELDYNCVSWNADNALFEVPTSVTFMELGR